MESLYWNRHTSSTFKVAVCINQGVSLVEPDGGDVVVGREKGDRHVVFGSEQDPRAHSDNEPVPVFAPVRFWAIWWR